MGDVTTPLPLNLQRGTYAPSGPNDKRTPCPVINSLANHGYINRTGRNIHASQLQAAINEVGLSRALGALLTNSIFNEQQDSKAVSMQKKPSLLARIWAIIRNPWIVMARFGMRRRDQVDSQGRKVLDLDQFAIPGIVEHDVSLSRCDHQQKEGNLVLQQDLVEDLLASSTDGKVLTVEDLAAFRKRRIQRQLDDNPGLKYGPQEHKTGCSELGLILGVFGNGKSIPCEYARALFKEERLPVKEGWRKHWLWTFGFLELFRSTKQVQTAIGIRL
ncbi:hypothetical protein H2200_010702 [Cladophialophora chaetospira]|uniref:Heme haloperoxidase family profile domain-containing protein n=1 Tax=Cladophialophora chaetospira TaxID=386627 RepID=A0AA38X0L6_9EURO|nr:hypothetical protein H2200_010702 [Cladophialophora chaetospira]